MAVCHPDRMMPSSLLGVLLSTCFSSAMLVPMPTTLPNDIDHNQTYQMDPNTFTMPIPSGNPPPFDPPWNNSMLTRQGPFPPGTGGNGPVDPTICDILLNAPDPPPIDKVPWFCVCSHCKYTDGPKGDRGDRGLPGSPGSPGIRGLMGFRGPPGFVGKQGLKGQKGDDGPKGDQGPIGISGAKGNSGYKGDKGDRGLEGLQGVAGPPGEIGQCPVSCQSSVGPPGPPGASGPVGSKGLPGVPGAKGEVGLKGDVGDRGMPGMPGSNGTKGDRGEKGICNCTDGAKGTAGQNGTSGAKGDKGDIGYQGPLGLPGPKGSQGDTGIDGPPGPCSPAIQSAFFAAMIQPFPQPNMPIPFPSIIYNVQMNFNPSTSVYQAPVNGTYAFSFHLAVYSKVLKVGLFRNFAPVVKITEQNNLATASQQVVLHLTRGDRVWLQVKDSVSNGAYADSESTSTFTGYLLYPDSCDLALSRDFPQEPATQTYSWGDDPTQPPTTQAGV